MPTQVAINGFGRTGRATFRAAYEQGADIEWVGINDVMDVQMLAHLLRHDSVYGPFPGKVEVLDGAIRVDGREIPVFAETDPANLPWGDIGAEVVIESSGFFRDRAGAAKHLEAGRAQGHHLRAGARSRTSPSRWGSTSRTSTTPSATTSSPTRRAPRTASPPWRRSCTRRSASATA